MNPVYFDLLYIIVLHLISFLHCEWTGYISMKISQDQPRLALLLQAYT